MQVFLFAVNTQSSSYQAGTIVGIILLVLLLLAGGWVLVTRIMSAVSDDESAPPRRGTRDNAGNEDRPRTPLVPKKKLATRHKATLEQLRLVAAADPWFDPARLEREVERVVARLQRGWKDDDFQPLKELLHPECYDTFLRCYHDEKKKKSLTRWHKSELESTQVVHFKARGREDNQTFSVVVTASGKKTVQEFWTFQRSPKRWLLVQMRSSANTEPLTEPNELPSALPS